ncbi:hypothetical protein A3C32_02005 [Candidatus Daviesbacteria bacterium RIFCSPHIGHO2_02_FULL_41_14]|uniref:Uncharacterized protein n=1 Tax=Candidatus Daviesbacteria bacterium RIFCSPLOWO2_01_FULL_40_24 TaxID=1797787 RepID=A0A1F5MKL3_9BACT|nr:MAG: hypothetical protein A2780_00640 [Candidatus Daviesbacteria bacterium RIFCSPHIGHO2_01_FULL_41_45]OGE34346.1 MAG: hypothetical protein A3C32_02005 [Candidatus Daviesbacteria bacterium RIFCSPHIGHO2_02_FULL_41_14]OGE65893.1 MAG: hypothetical protein A3B49_00275 [Candidatus Daviesbacteria bacterium RIFCSPLOWO2_01_FULL_40_24]
MTSLDTDSKKLSPDYLSKEAEGAQYWTHRDITLPQHLSGTLRYASLVRDPYSDRSTFIFPFTRLLDGMPYSLLLRQTSGRYTCPNFSLDLGHLADDNNRDKCEVFKSRGWIDFSIWNYPRKATPSADKYGYIYVASEPYHTHPLVMRPIDRYKNWGIFVDNQLRRQGAGSALLSITRMVLKIHNVDHLLVAGIDGVQEGHPLGNFYRKQGTVFTDVCKALFREDLTADGVIPTEETEASPYAF